MLPNDRGSHVRKARCDMTSASWIVFYSDHRRSTSATQSSTIIMLAATVQSICWLFLPELSADIKGWEEEVKCL